MSDEVVTTPFGKFLVNDRDVIESTLKAGTLWDGPGFLQVIAAEYARFYEVGTTILDVGANVGSFSIYCAQHGAWRVVAVEAIGSTVARLKANLDLNRETCAAVVIPLEIAAYKEERPLFAPVIDPGNVGGTALQVSMDTGTEPVVPGEPLDNYRWLYGERVSLIKIDAQGCDGAALVGLQQTLAQHHPAVVFEWEEALSRPHGVSLEDVKALLQGLGYRIHPWPTHSWNFLATVPQP